jgi:hypothetical protein
VGAWAILNVAAFRAVEGGIRRRTSAFAKLPTPLTLPLCARLAVLQYQRRFLGLQCCCSFDSGRSPAQAQLGTQLAPDALARYGISQGSCRADPHQCLVEQGLVGLGEIGWNERTRFPKPKVGSSSLPGISNPLPAYRWSRQRSELGFGLGHDLGWAIADARGYANLLVTLMSKRGPA